MASIICSATEALVPVAPGTTVVSAAVLDDEAVSSNESTGQLSDRLGSAVHSLLDADVDVIVVGIEVDTASTIPRVFGEAMRDAALRGVLCVVPAGNRGGLTTSGLVGLPGTVAAVAGDDFGRTMPKAIAWPILGVRGLVAPGREIPAASLPSGYTMRSGSSFATALVAAAFARLRSLHGTLHSYQIWDGLLSVSAPRDCRVAPRLDISVAHRRLMAYERTRNEHRTRWS